MKRKVLKTLAVVLVGFSLVSYGAVVKASDSNISQSESGEVLKTKEIYDEILTRTQVYLDIKAKYDSETEDINALALNTWRAHLNEIYNDLFERLDNSKRRELETSQNEWRYAVEIEAREKTSDETQYVAYMANATKERCFELVDTYL